MNGKTLAVGHDCPGLCLRGNAYIFRKSVPATLRESIGQREIVISLKTSSLAEAMPRYEAALVAFEDRITEAKTGVVRSGLPKPFRKLAEVADKLGVRYRTMKDVSAQNDLLALQEKLAAWKANGSPVDLRFDAIFGEAEKEVTLTELLDNYLHHTRLRRVDLNAYQEKKAVNPKKRAINDLIEYVGKDDAASVSAVTGKAFREHLSDRVFRQEIKPDTANKTLGHLRCVFDAAQEEGLLSGPNPFLIKRLEEKRKGKRSAYSVEFI